MSSIIKNGIKRTNLFSTINKQSPSFQQIRSVYGSSKITDAHGWSGIIRMKGIIGGPDYSTGKVYLAGKHLKLSNKIPEHIDNQLRVQLSHFDSPYEKQLALIEPKNTEVMNAYYDLVKNEHPKKIGTLIFLGFQNLGGIDTLSVASKYLGVELFSEITKLNKFVIIHCNRNKDNISYFEEFNVDGSRNFKKIYDENIVKERVRKFSDVPSPFHSMTLYFESPTVDNLTLVIPPTFDYQSRTNRNQRIRRELLKYLKESPTDLVFYVPVVNGSKAFKESKNEITFCEEIDPFSTSTIPILTDKDDGTTKRNLITPESWLDFLGKKKLDDKDLLDLKNRIYKVFFRNNESYLKNLIVTKSKTTKSMLESFSLSIRHKSKHTQDFLAKLASNWSPYAITLKTFLTKIIETQIFNIFLKSMIKFGKFKNQDEIKISNNRKEPDAHEILKTIEGFIKLRSKGEYITPSLIEFLNLKDHWIHCSEKIRGQELPDFYRDQFIKEYTESLNEIREKQGIILETVTDHFNLNWNRDYKRILSSLLNNDFAHNLPETVIYNTIECMDQISKNILLNKDIEYAKFVVKYSAHLFENSINPEVYKTLICKEFTPSITYEQFRESILELRSSNEFENNEIEGFSSLWDYIYFYALSKKLAIEMVNISISSIINPLFSHSFQLVIEKDPASDLDDRVKDISNKLDYLKQQFDFVQKNK